MMKVETFSYRFAKEILTHPEHVHIYNEIIKICENCPIPVYKGKSIKQKKLDIVQQFLNTYFRIQFSGLKWEEEPLATPKNFQDELRGDFRKEFIFPDGKSVVVQVEVEFGNVASSYRDYFKFQLSFAYDMADICILIVPMDKLAKRIDSGVSNFEKTKKEIPSAKLSITVPILVIGLDTSNEPEWDLKSIEPDINVLRNKSALIRGKHYKLVRDYIDTLK
ncbi:BglII/BstYI family type II restriction endonuclease [Psychrobacillus sp. NPDC058041]|uniref:BglII/BstYI family type II restriction endonuclease n=1 Tax=Psychrobacillus sp. NPDC058041 TaxID=3346310 RepID=UPI0036D9CBC8